MAKLKPNEPTWFCYNCQEITSKRIAYVDGQWIVCPKYECVAAVILHETWKQVPVEPVEPEHPAICPTCKGEWKMAKLKKTTPLLPRSKEQLLHEQAFSGSEYDPGYVESLSSKIIRGVEKPPVGTVFAKDMTFETQYMNYEGTQRLVKLVSLRKDDVEIMFYSGAHREWLKCSVKHMYPLTLDLTGLTPEQLPKETTKMAKKDRKHTGTGKVAVPARAVNEKTGCKEGSVGDKIGLAILAYKTEDKRVEAAVEVVTESFKEKGKSVADKDFLLSKAKGWISYQRKLFPSLYPALEKVAKVAKVAKVLKKTPKARKEPVAA
jgi:hypothetical protein